MSRSRNDPPAPSKTSHLFAGRKAKEHAAVTHDSITADIAAFRKAGGAIERLGVTRSLLRIGRDDDESPAPLPANPSPTRSRR
jgi:hypothetical protein